MQKNEVLLEFLLTKMQVIDLTVTAEKRGAQGGSMYYMYVHPPCVDIGKASF